MRALGSAWLCLLWIGAADCNQKPAPVKNPSFLVLRPVSVEPRAGFSPVQTADGKIVHATGEIIMDLLDFECASARVLPNDKAGEFSVRIEATREGDARLRKYTEAHLGEPVGIFIDGQLFLWAIIRERFGGAIEIERQPPLSAVEAEKLRSAIAAGGVLE